MKQWITIGQACLLATCGALIAFSAPASADIIVVEGRLASDCGMSDCQKDANATLAITPEGATESGAATVPPATNENDPNRTRGGVGPLGDDECDDDLQEDLCDMDQPPEGFVCEDLGMGLELCAPDEDEETDESTHEEDDESELGCSGGGLSPSGMLGALWVLAFWFLRPKVLVLTP